MLHRNLIKSQNMHSPHSDRKMRWAFQKHHFQDQRIRGGVMTKPTPCSQCPHSGNLYSRHPMSSVNVICRWRRTFTPQRSLWLQGSFCVCCWIFSVVLLPLWRDTCGFMLLPETSRGRFFMWTSVISHPNYCCSYEHVRMLQEFWNILPKINQLNT